MPRPLRHREHVLAGAVLLSCLALQAWQPSFITAYKAPSTGHDVRSSTLSHRYEHGAQATSPLQATSMEAPLLALTLLACATVARSALANRSAGSRARATPKPRCVLVAATVGSGSCEVSQAVPGISLEHPPAQTVQVSPILTPSVEAAGDVRGSLSSASAPAPGMRPGAQRRRRHTEQGARQQRRACGARLMRKTPRAVPEPDAKLAALDMSKVRNKVQMGIRSTSTARCGNNGREAKNRPEMAAPVGCGDSHKVRVECCSVTRRSCENRLNDLRDL